MSTRCGVAMRINLVLGNCTTFNYNGLSFSATGCVGSPVLPSFLTRCLLVLSFLRSPPRLQSFLSPSLSYSFFDPSCPISSVFVLCSVLLIFLLQGSPSFCPSSECVLSHCFSLPFLIIPSFCSCF